MSLRDTMNHLNHLLAAVTRDLAKVGSGNKAAAQRVRTGTVKLEKISKLFRKESVAAEKSGHLKRKKPSKKAGKKSRKKR
ncbi:MAG: hctA [Parachlamydiales bacterium]|nr:hctA [Parachlamydiales bacterium]